MLVVLNMVFRAEVLDTEETFIPLPGLLFFDPPSCLSLPWLLLLSALNLVVSSWACHVSNSEQLLYSSQEGVSTDPPRTFNPQMIHRENC